MCEERGGSSRTIATWANVLITSEERALEEDVTIAVAKAKKAWDFSEYLICSP